MSNKAKILPDSEKVALVTGASRGIGRAIADELGSQGLCVVGTATTHAGAENISAHFKAQGIQGEGLMMNVCKPETVDEGLKLILEKYGTPSILVNNAGITRDGLFLRMKEEDWEAVINTNLTGIYRLTKACLRPMLKLRWGRIVNISSIVGITGSPGQANYVAAKAGLIGFTKSLAQEIAAYGITVNAVAPGFIRSDMTDKLTDKQADHILSKIPMSRMGSSEEIAHSVSYLTSNSAAYVTGQTLHINGGMCMV